jgi:hypothetical protein
MNAQKIVKTGQEQAVAAWIDCLNQVRFNELINSLNRQDGNLQDALDSLRSTMDTIKDNVIEVGRGGERGIHGFIAEVAEVGIGNARKAIHGEDRIYDWINDNGPHDIQIGDMLYQMKFARGGGCFSLNAVAAHLEKYPDYLERGNKYIIPKDFYEKVRELLALDESQAARLTSSGEGPSRKEWQRVRDFFDQHDIAIDDIEPSQLDYDEVQQVSIVQTMDNEEAAIRREDERLRGKAYEESKPTLGQAVQATAASAAVEGGTAFAMAVAKKIREGRQLRNFTPDDWTEIAKASGSGMIKGGIRGASIYSLTNFTATPGAVASSICTASFGVAEQAHKFRNQEIDEIELIKSSEIICLDAAVSALSSAIGQAVIPVPVLGAVIGNTVGTVIYQAAKDHLSDYEQKVFAEYAERQKQLDAELKDEYELLLDQIQIDMAEYINLLEFAFHPDLLQALDGSIKLAEALDVPQSEILDTPKKLDAYFLD